MLLISFNYLNNLFNWAQILFNVFTICYSLYLYLYFSVYLFVLVYFSLINCLIIWIKYAFKFIVFICYSLNTIRQCYSHLSLLYFTLSLPTLLLLNCIFSHYLFLLLKQYISSIIWVNNRWDLFIKYLVIRLTLLLINYCYYYYYLDQLIVTNT